MDIVGNVNSLATGQPDSSGRSTLAVQPAAKGSHPIRFVFVDGLRGLAALAIVIFHLWWYEPYERPASQFVGESINEMMPRLRAGVQVLLVISGFVIAYTLRNCWVNPREILMFLGRRFVRLAPPYWIALASVICVDALCQNAWDLESPFEGSVSIHRVSAHLTFLQDVLGHVPLSAGVWTICIEMQFYVVAILAWGLAQHITSRPVDNKPRPSMLGILVVYAPFAFASLFLWRPLESTEHWVIHFMWMFFLGMVAWWTLDGTLPRWVFQAVTVVALAEIAFDQNWWYENSIALLTAVMIYSAGRLNRLQSWLNWRWLQHIAKISYSLYLIHFPICHLMTLAGFRLLNDEPTPLQGVTIFVASFVTSIVAAHFLYIWVEEPSSRFSASLKRLPATAGRPIEATMPQSA